MQLWNLRRGDKELTKLVSDPALEVSRAAILALVKYANWRYEDAIGYAVRFQVKGVRQDPAMFRALVSLLQDKEEPVRSTAAGILMPLYEPSGQGAQRRRSPEGGWEKWLEDITATDTDALRSKSETSPRDFSSH